ncbi:MAG: hypothetical protein ABSA14_14105 [Acidimicrobiales bacterium]
MNPIGFIEIVSSPDLLPAKHSDGSSPYAVDRVEALRMSTISFSSPPHRVLISGASKRRPEPSLSWTGYGTPAKPVRTWTSGPAHICRCARRGQEFRHCERGATLRLPGRAPGATYYLGLMLSCSRLKWRPLVHTRRAIVFGNAATTAGA